MNRGRESSPVRDGKRRQVWAREDGVFTQVDTCSVYKNGSVFLIISIEVNGSRIIVSNSHSYYFIDDIKPECLEVEQEIVWTVKKRDTDYPSERLLPWY